MDEIVRERTRMRVEVRLHDEQGRKDCDEDVEREKCRLQRAFDLLIVPPGTDRNPGARSRILALDPLVALARSGRNSALRRRYDVRSARLW